jgi:hypothetical protein
MWNASRGVSDATEGAASRLTAGISGGLSIPSTAARPGTPRGFLLGRRGPLSVESSVRCVDMVPLDLVHRSKQKTTGSGPPSQTPGSLSKFLSLFCLFLSFSISHYRPSAPSIAELRPAMEKLFKVCSQETTTTTTHEKEKEKKKEKEKEKNR